MNSSCVTVVPKRNTISFNGLTINENICNDFLQIVLNEFKNKFDKNKKYNIQVSNHKHIAIVTDDKNIVDRLIKDERVVFIKVNNTIYKSNRLIETINDVQISRLYNSFHQSCDETRLKTHEFVMNKFMETEINRVLLIAGECYIYAKLLQKINKDIDIHCYSKDKSIADDVKFNLGIDAELYDVNDIRLDDTKNYDVAILNISKAGLKRKTCEELSRIYCKKLIYISCRHKYYVRDMEVLKTRYEQSEYFKINTKGHDYDSTLCIYVLNRIE